MNLSEVESSDKAGILQMGMSACIKCPRIVNPFPHSYVENDVSSAKILPDDHYTFLLGIRHKALFNASKASQNEFPLIDAKEPIF